MSDAPRCTTCGRTAADWIDVEGTRWEPDLKKVAPSSWRCWACREERHPDMPQGHLPDSFKQKVQQFLDNATEAENHSHRH